MNDSVHIPATASTCHWGFFDANLRPVARVRPGQRVTVDTINGAPESHPADPTLVLPETGAIHAGAPRALGPHILTGPIAVEGAEPGDVIEVRFVDIALRQDWGFMLMRPLMGTLPDDFPISRLVHIGLDRSAGVALPPWGGRVAVRPFFGVVGVAPPAGWGRVSTTSPGLHGGNLDNKEMIAGTSLYLPVHVREGLVSFGDGHAVQGDGEVCVTAVETALTGTVEFHLHKGRPPALPRIETAGQWITSGLHTDLDQAMVIALREMIGLIRERTNLTAEDAYMLSSIAADFRVTQTVNVVKGVHGIIDKATLAGIAS